MTATDLALKILARLSREDQVTVLRQLGRRLFPEPDPRNCFNHHRPAYPRRAPLPAS